MSAAEILSAEGEQGDLLPEHESALSTSADFLTLVEAPRGINGINFRSETATLALDVSHPNLAESLVDADWLSELTEQGFQLTDQPHITILNYSSGGNIRNALEQYSATGRDILLRDIERIAQRQDWAWSPTGKIHPFVGRSRSMLKLIAMIDCPAVADFYREVEELIPGAEIERHPMHITLLKKAADVKAPAEASLGNLNLGRPLNGLGHLALGYENPIGRRPKPEVKTKEIPWHVREYLLKHFRVEPTDWLVFSDEELELVQGVADLGLPLPTEIMEKTAADMQRIDLLGAAAVSRRLALVPEALEHLIPGSGGAMPTPELTPLERATIFDEIMERELEALRTPEIVSHKVITGAIVKLAALIQNQRLIEETDRRLAQQPEHYQVRVKSMGTFRQMGDTLLKEVLRQRQEVEEALQTGVDRVQ